MKSMPNSIATKQYSVILGITSKIIGLILILMLSACNDEKQIFAPKKPHSIAEYANGEVDGDPCVIKTAKAILKSGLKYPNIEYTEHQGLLSRDIWAGSTLLRFKYRGEREEGWGLFNGGLTPDDNPLASNLVQGSIISTLKLNKKALNFKDPKAGGTLYGEFTCFYDHGYLQDIEARSVQDLKVAIDQYINKNFPPTHYVQRRKNLKDIGFIEIFIYEIEDESKQITIYLPLKESKNWGNNQAYQPIECQRAYAPDEISKILPFQCGFSLRVGTDAVLRVRTYQQMLPYLPRFRTLVKERLEKYIQPQ